MSGADLIVESDGLKKLEKKLEEVTKEMNEELAKNAALKSEQQELLSARDKARGEEEASLKILSEAETKVNALEETKKERISATEKAKDDLLETGIGLLDDLGEVEMKRRKLHYEKESEMLQTQDQIPNVGVGEDVVDVELVDGQSRDA